MGKMQREKGKRYEREIASKLREYGYEARRSAQYCGNTGDAADVIGLPGLHIECKHAEQMRLYDWMTQAVNDSRKNGRLPAVFHRKNNCDTLVTMRFDDWMQIYRNSDFWKGEP